MEKLYSDLHKMYPVSKTLKFELKPIGKTLEYIKDENIIEEDEKRSDVYGLAKRVLDNYHKRYIEVVLKNLELNGLKDYVELMNSQDMDKKKKIEDKLRKQIADCFNESKTASDILKELKDKASLKEEIMVLEYFNRFTTYFNTYNTNRKNMYVSEEKSTSIAYRLINENLPIFIDNMKNFKKINQCLGSELIKLKEELDEYIQVEKIEEMFELEYYNDVLTQRGIEVYNIIISGKSEEDGNTIKGLNEYVNLYNQKNPNNKLPKLRELYKQILSDRNTASFVIDFIENDNELIEMINNTYNECQKALKGDEKTLGITHFIQNIEEYDLDKIYISDSITLFTLSQQIYGDWEYIKRLWKNTYKRNIKNEEDINKFNNEFKKEIFSIRKIEELIEEYDNTNVNKFVKYIKDTYKEKLSELENSYKQFREDLNTENTGRKLINDDSKIEIVKNLLDTLKSIQELLKVFVPKNIIGEKDEVFYSEYLILYVHFSQIISVYNKARNYLSQKPYSKTKFKLNFKSSSLLAGWDLSKERDYHGVIFLKDKKYYLGIINSTENIFDCYEKNEVENVYKKMEYKQLTGLTKQLPRICFSNARKEQFAPSEEIIKKYDMGCHKKGENFDINFLHQLIDYYKRCLTLNETWKVFNFKFGDTKSYQNINEFLKDVEEQTYVINYKNYSEKYINSLVEEGKLYLFQIYNKDFSEFSKGKENLHTMYWKALFDEENLRSKVYKLNGNAEIFYRKASIERKITHPKNVEIKNKNEETIKRKETSIFTYDLIKDKRFSEDKFEFHVPITMNFINKGKNRFNEIVNKYLKYNDVNVIGIDRGERNLIYVVVIDSKGKILEQISLNEIVNNYKGTEYKTDYHKLLDKKEGERKKARESWKKIENIKELKEGYISQVVHKIVELVENYNAIIVLEDLNYGFKNSRIKVEKQVYQKFEKMLIEKMNYLVFKNKNKSEEGGLLNAYQLTNKFDSFNKLGKQSGILFYIPAWCTSKIDPTTGFVNLINTRYENIHKAKELISNIDDIKYNKAEEYFEFFIDYKKLTPKSYGTINKWIVCTYGNRIETIRDKENNDMFVSKYVNITNELLELLNKYDVNLDNIKEGILNIENKEFFEGFLRLLRLTLQMRNSISNTEIDYIISPVKNEFGRFYNSNDGIYGLPKDADANGAYNIARKGLMVVDQIRHTEDDKLEKVKFDIKNEAWLKFVQEGNN